MQVIASFGYPSTSSAVVVMVLEIGVVSVVVVAVELSAVAKPVVTV